MGNLSLCGFGTFWVRSSIVMDSVMTGCITENQSFDFFYFLRRFNDWLSPYSYVGTWTLSDWVGPGRTHHLLCSSYSPKGPGENTTSRSTTFHIPLRHGTMKTRKMSQHCNNEIRTRPEFRYIQVE